MFDADRKLVICNNDLRHPLRPAARTGTAGNVDRGDPRSTASNTASIRSAKGRTISRRRDRADRERDGKTSIPSNCRMAASSRSCHHPMADGGWVSTHQDITEQRQIEARIRHHRAPRRADRPAQPADVPRDDDGRRGAHRAAARRRRPRHRPRSFQGGQRYARPRDRRRAAQAGGASACKEACRQGDDMIARLGGDEFAVLTGAAAPRAGRRRGRRPHRQADGDAVRRRRQQRRDRRQRRHRGCAGRWGRPPRRF